MPIIDGFLYTLTLITALGCGLVAGVFYAFSTFVMKALARLPAAQGIAAMQSINVVVINPWFMTVFFGTAAACVVVVVFSMLRWGEPSAVYLLIGSLLYLIGTILVTIVFNVHETTHWRPLTQPAPMAPACGLATSPVGQPGTTCGRRQRWWQRYCSPSRSVTERQSTAKEDSGAATLLKATPVT
jgi:uncharacterized membrane protein